MEKFKAIIQALTGYVGSSENPEKISARFVGTSMALITFLAPFLGKFLGMGAEQIIAQVQPIAYMIAIVWYVYGAIKAMWTAAKAHPTLGAYLK